jgi:VWFA-related protein
MRWFGLLALATFAFAQNQAVFRATTQLVRIDVAAEDKDGKPVTDLTKDDFELKVSGKPEGIATFTVATTIPAPAEPLPRGTFTNRQEAVEVSQGRHVVILLDWRNTNWQLQSLAHQELIKVATQLRDGDKVALYLVNDRLQIVQEFTADHERIKEKAETLWGELQEPQHNRLQAEQAVRDTLTTFRAIAQHLAGISGQKVLVWISMGFPGSASVPDDIDRAVHTLGNANIVVESVDPEYLGMSKLPPELGPVHVSRPILRAIAERTGGQYFDGQDSNDIGGRFLAAANDRATSYELGYYAGDVVTPGLQPFEIKCGRPGVTLRYREGYYVEKKPPPPGPTDIRAIAQDTLEAAVDTVAIPLTATVRRTMGNVGSAVVALSIDEKALSLKQEGDHWTGKISVFARFAGDEDEQYGAVPMDTPPLILTQAQHDKFLRDGLPRRFTMKIPSGASTLRVLVRDDNSGSTGSVTISVDDLPEF